MRSITLAVLSATAASLAPSETSSALATYKPSALLESLMMEKESSPYADAALATTPTLSLPIADFSQLDLSAITTSSLGPALRASKAPRPPAPLAPPLDFCTHPEGFQIVMTQYLNKIVGVGDALSQIGVKLDGGILCNPRAVEFHDIPDCPSSGSLEYQLHFYANSTNYDQALQGKISAILNQQCSKIYWVRNSGWILGLTVPVGLITLGIAICLLGFCIDGARKEVRRRAADHTLNTEQRRLRQTTAGAVAPSYGSDALLPSLLGSRSTTANPVFMRTTFTGREEAPTQTALATRAYRCTVQTATSVANSARASGAAFVGASFAAADATDRARIRAVASFAGLFPAAPRYQTIGTATPGILTAASSTVTAGGSDLADRYAARQTGQEAETLRAAL